MNIIGYRKFWISLSLSLIIAGAIVIIFFRPALGIDFTGGTLVEIKTTGNVGISDVRSGAQNALATREVTVQESGQNQFLIRSKTLEGENYNKFANSLNSTFKDVNILRHESIGAIVGADLTRKAIYGILLASVLIIIYLAYAFRSVPRSVSPWAFGSIAIGVLLHDLSVSFAIFSIIARISGFEIDSMIVVAILTILGFSVHDTIVIFDRIRENIIKNPQKSLAENANVSVNQTFARSLNTSLTVILVLISMIILGGATIKPFVIMLAIGIAIGTYSSIFIAAPTLVSWFAYKKRNK